jgi:hypothetical protein
MMKHDSTKSGVFMLIKFALLVTALFIAGAVVLGSVSPNGGGDRNVPGATTGPGRASLQDPETR